MNLFRYLDYRIILGKLIEERRKQDPKFKQEILAEASGIQKTYLSKVLNGSADLNSDQLFEIIEFFKLDTESSDYLFLLLEYARTSKAKRKRELQVKIGAIQLRHKNIKNQIQRKILSPGASGPELEYFLDPVASIIHQCLQIKKYQGNPELIAEKLGISKGYLQSVLKCLQNAELAQFDEKNKQWQVSDSNFHLAKESRMSAPRLHLLRQFAAQHMMKIPLSQRFSYSTTMRADEATMSFIHERILALLREIDPVIEAASEEGVYELSFDLFPWALE